MEIGATFFKQTEGDIGDPFQYGGIWKEYRLTDDPLFPSKETGGFMEMAGSDAGGPEGRCYIEYKHVSASGNIKRRKGFRDEDWCNNWIRQHDIDCMGE